MEGVRLAALFSLGCSEVAFRFDYFKTLTNFLMFPSRQDLINAQKILENLPVLYPYLQAIAICNDLNPFDKKVVEAYFVGNELLERVSFQRICGIIQQILEKRKVEKGQILEILNNLPSNIKPHHNFHVLYLFPKISKERISMNLLELCRVAWARVIGRGQRQLEVEYIPLRKEKGRIRLEKEAIRITIGYAQEIFPRIEIGDIIALHWGKPCMVLSQTQVQLLERYTKEALNCAKIEGER